MNYLWIWILQQIRKSWLSTILSFVVLKSSHCTYFCTLELRWLRVCLQCRKPGFNTYVRKIPGRKAWQLTPVFLLGEFHGQRSLVSYSPWGHIEWDTPEQLIHTHTHTHTHTHLGKLSAKITSCLAFSRCSKNIASQSGEIFLMCYCYCNTNPLF